MRNRSVSLACFLAWALSGCAVVHWSEPPPGPAFASVQQTLPAVPPGKGRVFIFRQSAYAGSRMEISIALSGKPIGTSYDGSILYADLDPGHADLILSNPSPISIGHATVPLDVAAGETRFVELFVPETELPLTGGGLATLPGGKPVDSEAEAHCGIEICGRVVRDNEAAPVVGKLTLEASTEAPGAAAR